MNGFYYLHTNGQLIWKKFEPEGDSPFVKRIWNINTTRREHAWRVIIESLYLGADHDCIRRLVNKWNIDKYDLPNYLVYDNKNITEERKQGLKILIEKIWKEDYNHILNPETLKILANTGRKHQ